MFTHLAATENQLHAQYGSEFNEVDWVTMHAGWFAGSYMHDVNELCNDDTHAFSVSSLASLHHDRQILQNEIDGRETKKRRTLQQVYLRNQACRNTLCSSST